MEKIAGEYLLTDETDLINATEVQELLSRTYWAGDRTLEEIELSMSNSECFGILDRGRLAGFGRVVTDGVSVYWLCDVVVDESYRGKGLGKLLLDFILEDHNFQGLGILITKDAHGLYERYGYKVNEENFMIRSN